MAIQVQEQALSTWADQISLHVQTAGSGPPVLFLHGAGGLTWDPFLDRLAEAHTVYAPQHPGTTPGDPDAVRSLDDLWDLVVLYAETMDRLGLERTAVVGHSFGGMVAAELAANYPDRITRLVLIGPIGLWRDDVPIRNIGSYSAEELPGAIFADPDSELAKQFFALPEDPDAAAEAQARFVWAMGTTLGKFAWPIPDKGLRKRIYRVKAPTLVVWGTDDRLIPPAYAEEFAARIPGARVEYIEGAGHLPQLEQPESVSRLVLAFLGE